MSQVTHASQIVTQLEYIEETTYRTFPTNPAMVFMAEVAKWTPDFDMSAKGFKRHGSEDIYKVLQGKQMFKSSLEFGISNSTFIKYAILATAGAGTINKSLSIGFSQKIDNVENFIKLFTELPELFRELQEKAIGRKLYLEDIEYAAKN